MIFREPLDQIYLLSNKIHKWGKWQTEYHYCYPYVNLEHASIDFKIKARGWIHNVQIVAWSVQVISVGYNLTSFICKTKCSNSLKKYNIASTLTLSNQCIKIYVSSFLTYITLFSSQWSNHSCPGSIFIPWSPSIIFRFFECVCEIHAFLRKCLVLIYLFMLYNIKVLPATHSKY